jgi:hypothetical protein
MGLVTKRTNDVLPKPDNLISYRHGCFARLAAGEAQADIGRTYNVDATTIGRLVSPVFLVGKTRRFVLEANAFTLPVLLDAE